MLTAVVAAARRARRPISVLATYPELWAGNTDPATIEFSLPRWIYAVRRGWIRTEVVHLSYENGIHRHLAEQMASRLNLSLTSTWRPTLPSVHESSRDPSLIVVQNSCRGARYRAETKEWAQEKWRELVRRLAGAFRLVQLGTSLDPLLPEVEDQRSRTTLLGAAALLARARLFVGLESGLMHIAAATRTPAVIIYGGRSRPHETGYPFNRNITREPFCAGCGLNEGCPHNVICLDIPVSEVEESVRAMLQETATTSGKTKLASRPVERPAPSHG